MNRKQSFQKIIVPLPLRNNLTKPCFQINKKTVSASYHSLRNESLKIKMNGAGFKRGLFSQVSAPTSVKFKISHARASSLKKTIDRLPPQPILQKKVVFPKKQAPKTAFISIKNYYQQRYQPKQQQYSYIQADKIQSTQQIEEHNLSSILLKEYPMGEFQSDGFGVTANLSKFDLPSLEDPEGKQFLAKYKNSTALCPYYINNRYEWTNVIIKEFDVAQNKVIVQKQNHQIKNVSRLSLKFKGDKFYWRRINFAIKLFKKVHQEMKYERYIANRKQILENPHSYSQFNKEINEIIFNKCFIPYSKQFIVYKEMKKVPQKFIKIGIKLRRFKPFKQMQHFNTFQPYQESFQKLSQLHYSSVSSLAYSLSCIYSRLSLQHCINKPKTSLSLNEYIEHSIIKIKQKASMIKIKNRQLILTDIFYFTNDKFKNKQQSFKYYRLHHYIFRDTIVKNFYQANLIQYTNYLSLFSEQTIVTPLPIIDFHLSIQSKEITMHPSKQQFKQFLMQPAYFLQKETELIPEISKDLLSTPTTFITIPYLRLELLIESINLLLKASYQPIQQYVSHMKSKSKYLHATNSFLHSFSTQGRQLYEKQIIQICADLRQILHSNLFKAGIFNISLIQFKNIFSNAIERKKKKLAKTIQKQVIQENINMKNKFKEITQIISKIPIDEQQLVDMRKFIQRECKVFLNQSQIHYFLSHQFYQLLLKYYLPYDEKQYFTMTEIILEKIKFQEAMDNKLVHLNIIEAQFIEKINLQREQIMRGIDEIFKKIQQIEKFYLIEKYNEYYVETNKNYYLIKQYFTNLQNINVREKILNQQLSMFQQLQKLYKRIEPYHILWNTAFDQMTLFEQIYAKPIISLHYLEIKSTITQHNKILSQLLSIFITIRNPNAAAICEIMQKKILSIMDKLWVVECFTKEGMIKKEQMRKSALDSVFKQNYDSIQIKDISLNDLLKNDVQNQKQFVQKTANHAQKIWKLEVKLAQTIQEIKKLQFVFYLQNGLKFVDQFQLKILLSATKQQRQVTQIIQSQDPMLEKKITNVIYKLQLIQNTIQTMIPFQNCFQKILRVMSIPILANQLVQQKMLLSEVQKMWKNQIAHFTRDVPQLWQIIDSQTYKNRMLNAIETIKKINNKVKQYLNEKRHLFPRLYFVSDQEIITIMSTNTLNCSTLQKIFPGIKAAIIEQNKIVGWVGHYQEKAKIKNFVNNNIVIWERLRVFLQQIKKVVSANIMSKQPQLHMATIVQAGLQWTNKMEICIVSNSLPSLLGKINQKISFKQQTNKLQYKKQIHSFSKITQLIYFRDTLQHVIASHVSDLFNYEWIKQFRYYKAQANVQIRTIHLNIGLQHEYDECTLLPYFYTSDKQCIHFFLNCRHMNTAMTTNNSNVIKDIAILIQAYYVQVNEVIDHQGLFRFLNGAIFGHTWLQFIKPMSYEVMSILAQVLYDVQQAVRSERLSFHLKGEEVRITRNHKLTLLLTPSPPSLYARVTVRLFNYQQPNSETIISLMTQANHYSPLLKQQIIFTFKILSKYRTEHQLINIFIKLFPQHNASILLSIFIKIVLSTMDTKLAHQIKQQLSLDKLETTQDLLKQAIANWKQETPRIIVLGQYYSGRRHIISKVLKQVNIIIPITYNENETNKKSILLKQQINEISIDIITSSIIVYHRGQIPIQQFIQQQIQMLFPVHSDPIRLSLQKQILILKHQYSSLYNVLLMKNIINGTYAITRHHQINNSHKEQQIRQLIFLVIYWQCHCYNDSVVLHPNDFSSGFISEEYFYDPTKGVWLQWTTMNNNSNKSVTSFHEIYLPLRETVIAEYFATAFLQDRNIAIVSPQSGNGMSALLKTKLSNFYQILQINKHVTFQSLSKLINKKANILQRNGTYSPPLNKNLIIGIQDVHLSNKNLFPQLSLLLSHRINLERTISKTKFICTLLNIFSALRRVADGCLLIPLDNIGQQSQQNIFSYYLDWFFGNTENPFSKEVRQMIKPITNISIALFKQLPKNDFVSFKRHCMVFEGITKCSPKTVKTAKDIMNLWRNQFINTILQTDSMNFQDSFQILNKKLKSFSLQNARNNTFILCNKINLPYSQTYRQMTISQIQSHLKSIVQQICCNDFPIIVYPQLFEYIPKVLRVLNTSSGHMLIEGAPNNGKTTIFKVGVYLKYNKLIHSITDTNQNCLTQLSTYLCNNYSQLSLPIILSSSFNSNSFLMALHQIMTGELNTLQTNILKQINVTSVEIQKYKNFQKYCQHKTHILLAVNGPLSDYSMIVSKMMQITHISVFNAFQQKRTAQIAINCSEPIIKLMEIFPSMNIPIYNKNLFILLQFVKYYHQRINKVITTKVNRVQTALQRIAATEEQKQRLLMQLRLLYPKVIKIEQQLRSLDKECEEYTEFYKSEECKHNDNKKSYLKEQEHMRQLESDMQQELNKVYPILAQAQQAMEHITRDHINQLRSFPNPPLPATKVCESLIVVFNETHLVKEKVLENGVKIRDFWEYSKKFILNDKLLKRVMEYKPETIKDIPPSVINSIKQIVKKPQFIQEKVFKASVAAGNLSLWIRSIVKIYDVMMITEPKKILFIAAQVALAEHNVQMNEQANILQDYYNTMKEKETASLQKRKEKDQLTNQVRIFEQQLSLGEDLLIKLNKIAEVWNNYLTVIVFKQKQEALKQSILLALYFYFLHSIPLKQRHLQEITQILHLPFNYSYFNIPLLSIHKYSLIHIENNKLPICKEWLQNYCLLKQIVSFYHQRKHFLHIFIDETSHVLTFLQLFHAYTVIDLLQHQNQQYLLSQIIQKRDDEEEQLLPHKNIILLNYEYNDYWLHHYQQIFISAQQNNTLIFIIVKQRTPQFQKLLTHSNIVPTLIQLTSCIIQATLQNILQFNNALFKQIQTEQHYNSLQFSLIQILITHKNILSQINIIQQWRSIYSQYLTYPRKVQKIPYNICNKLSKATIFYPPQHYFLKIKQYEQDKSRLSQQQSSTSPTQSLEQFILSLTDIYSYTLFSVIEESNKQIIIIQLPSELSINPLSDIKLANQDYSTVKLVSQHFPVTQANVIPLNKQVKQIIASIEIWRVFKQNNKIIVVLPNSVILHQFVRQYHWLKEQYEKQNQDVNQYQGKIIIVTTYQGTKKYPSIPLYKAQSINIKDELYHQRICEKKYFKNIHKDHIKYIKNNLFY